MKASKPPAVWLDRAEHVAALLDGAGELHRAARWDRRHVARRPNLRRRVLAPAVKRANERLTEAGEVPLPESLTPHKLRHTFASILIALGVGVDPGAVMDQLGHTDPAFTLRVYRQGMRRDEQSKHALRELVGFPIGQRSGSSADFADQGSAAIPYGRGWVRTSDLSRVKRALSH